MSAAGPKFRVTTGRKNNSAYFSEEDTNIEDNNPHTTSIVTNFPISRTCLWTRKYCSFGIEIHPHDVIPIIHLYSNVINDIVQQYSSSMNVDCLAMLISNSSLNDTEKEFLQHRSPKTSSVEHFRLVWIGSSVSEKKLNPFLTVKIPVIMRPASEGIIDFEIERTQNLLKNLENGIKYGRNFGLRSCIRIRAAGCFHQTTPTRSKISRNQRVTMKFEAILPDVSFQARRIQSLPIQLTPLSRMITQGTRDTENLASHSMGYLTLTETRKIVILHETDSSTNNIMSTPVVGVWISLPDLVTYHSINEDAGQILLNPIIWGCCLRYICNQNILEKVWVDERTFLLIVFTAYDTYSFEVTPDWSIEITNKGMEGPLNYLCYDFATDLFSSDHGAEEPDSNSILAKFRPTKNIELIRLCNPAKIVDPTKYKNLVSHDSQYSDSIPPDTDSMTPLPRASRPDPEVIPKFDPERLKEQHTESDNSDNFEEALVREGIHEAQSEKNEYVPKELFLQQQEVIYELQNQIQSLQREIISLKEKLAEKVQEEHVFPSKPNHEQFVDKDPPSCRLDYADENPPADPKPTYYYSSQETIRPQFIEDKSNEISEFQEEESFLCHKPFEPCEMEAPSIFNFDLFIQTLKDRQDPALATISLPIEASLSTVPNSYSDGNFISTNLLPLPEESQQWHESESILNIERRYGKR